MCSKVKLIFALLCVSIGCASAKPTPTPKPLKGKGAGIVTPKGSGVWNNWRIATLQWDAYTPNLQQFAFFRVYFNAEADIIARIDLTAPFTATQQLVMFNHRVTLVYMTACYYSTEPLMVPKVTTNHLTRVAAVAVTTAAMKVKTPSQLYESLPSNSVVYTIDPWYEPVQPPPNPCEPFPQCYEEKPAVKK